MRGMKGEEYKLIISNTIYNEQEDLRARVYVLLTHPRTLISGAALPSMFCHRWGKWNAEGILSDNILAYNSLQLSPGRVAFQDFSIPLIEFTWLLLTISLITAVTLRRRLYFIFQATHRFVGIIFFVTSIIHSWSFWYVFMISTSVNYACNVACMHACMAYNMFSHLVPT